MQKVFFRREVRWLRNSLSPPRVCGENLEQFLPDSVAVFPRQRCSLAQAGPPRY